MKKTQGWTLIEILISCCLMTTFIGILHYQLRTYHRLHLTKNNLIHLLTRVNDAEQSFHPD